jgi:hypothetical protein
MISATALGILVWSATIAGALVPIILVALFIIDYKTKEIW